MRVYLCRGSSCRKRNETRELLERLDAAGIKVKSVGCQKICKGPVAGIDARDRLEWFRRLRSKKSQRALLELITVGELKASLRRRRVKKRRNQLR